jgi:transcription initiation factor TFIID subunit 1
VKPSGDYLHKPPQSVQRRRIDPRVAFSSILQTICSELRATAPAAHFLQPVNPRTVVDYHSIVKQPMDLSRVRANIAANVYETREAFLRDIRLILDNSRLYNGDLSEITRAGRELFEEASRRVLAKEARCVRLEKCINPLLDDNDTVAFNYILQRVIDRCKAVPKSYPFHVPVDAKRIRHYYTMIERPIDLGTMAEHCRRHKYISVQVFDADLQRIYDNCLKFNGLASSYTSVAASILESGRQALAENAEALSDLQRVIQQTAMATGGGEMAEQGAAMVSMIDRLVSVTEEDEIGMFILWEVQPLHPSQMVTCVRRWPMIWATWRWVLMNMFRRRSIRLCTMKMNR